ncbi:site-specific integrase [Limosilactobacillus reuteri]|uniref:Tyrosine-type recombinase/integrase n=1 Tax=Limosilactobacillus reuteri TaxID=1598 RepID=A0A347TAK6_LIMRT|nr:site-specific integrase [Limosilactobacillus reuteri]MRG69139.1 tyrosine-type recombinase/integrase [Limosilactobacillus reuteri]
MRFHRNDINCLKYEITINKSWDYVDGGKFKPTKSKSSNRTIRVNQEFLNIIAELNKNDFHSLRHAHVAYLLSQGADLTIISKRLGHADTTVTSKVYAYLIDEYKDKAENQIEKYLENI